MQPAQLHRGVFLKRAVGAAGLAHFCSASSTRIQAASSRDKGASGQTVRTGAPAVALSSQHGQALSPPSQPCCGAMTMAWRQRKLQQEGLWGMAVLHGPWPHGLRLGPLGRWTSSLGQKPWHSSLSAAEGAMAPVSCDLNLEESCNLHLVGASLVAQMVRNLPAMQETRIQFLGWEYPLRRAWQPTPVFLLGESHGQRSLAGHSPRGHRVRHD